jgi:hypothetical protein
LTFPPQKTAPEKCPTRQNRPLLLAHNTAEGWLLATPIGRCSPSLLKILLEFWGDLQQLNIEVFLSNMGSFILNIQMFMFEYNAQTSIGLNDNTQHDCYKNRMQQSAIMF